MHAVKSDHPMVCEFLVERKSDLAAVDNEGKNNVTELRIIIITMTQLNYSNRMNPLLNFVP
jgi:hypothetical protein